MACERARLLVIFQVSKPKITAGVALVSPSSLTSPCSVPCLDQLADLALWEAELVTDPVVVESALMGRLATVPDQRSVCGLRHPLVVILTLTACATLVAGSDSVAAISGYVADVVRQTAPIPQIPDTPGPVEREQRRAARRQFTHPAPDGLLPQLEVTGRVLTLDALHTTKATARPPDRRAVGSPPPKPSRTRCSISVTADRFRGGESDDVDQLLERGVHQGLTAHTATITVC